jgi:phosphoribosylformimino-5-aminoimidazole carboxamide ribotide isomerase
MRIIPVLDLKGGEVVRAQQGRRDRYQPIVTPLSAGSDAVSVASGLRRLYPFQTFYIADLDAIEGRSPNRKAVESLKSMDGAPRLWLDSGLAGENALADALEDPLLQPVLGSESQRDESLLKLFRDHPDLILSLDFFGDGYHGPDVILHDPTLWPQTVIVMTLVKVGSAAGPDFARLEEMKAKAGRRAVIAAGGVRHETDVRELSALGISGALVATSLHDGSLSARQLHAIQD